MGSRPDATVREFEERDVDALCALIQRTIKTSYSSFYSSECMDFFCDHHPPQSIIDDAKAGIVLVVEEKGAIVATGTLVGNEIKRVFVEPSHQGAGYGRIIMERLEVAARVQGMTTVELDASLPAKPFYDRLGYETESARERELRSDSLRYYRMKRSLSKTNK